MCCPHSFGRVRVRTALPLAVLVASAIAAPALANPVIPSAILVHVQAIDPNFCLTTPIADCEGLVSATPLAGPLEFDVLFHIPDAWAGIQVNRLMTTVSWPSQWEVFQTDICNQGTGTIDINGNEADLDLTWAADAFMNGELFLAARFLVVVTGHGHFGQLDSFVGWADIDNGLELYPIQLAAEAGDQCAICSQPCDPLGPQCHPTPDPTEISLELSQGHTAERVVDVVVHGEAGCPSSYSTTASWLAADRTLIGANHWRYSLVIDTAPLDPGAYEGWLHVDSECRGCTRVVLSVLPPTSALPEGRQWATWGRVKTTYR